MNIPLLLRVKEQILKEPKQFLMRGVFSTITDLGSTPPNCGTAACIAGWTLALHKNVKPSSLNYISLGSPLCQASLILDLTYEQREKLFFLDGWPTNFHDAYDFAKTEEKQAKITAKRIDHFIATNGEE